MKKTNIAAVAFSALLIIVFCIEMYWMNSLYSSQKNIFEKTVNLVFKETIQELEITAIKKDITATTSLLEATLNNSAISNIYNINFYDSINENTVESLYKNKLSHYHLSNKVAFNINIKNDVSNNDNYATDKIYLINDNSKFFQATFSKVNQYVLLSIFYQIIIAALFFIFCAMVLWYAFKIIAQQQEVETYKNQFISTLTHEFKTPISSVNIIIESLIQQAAQINKTSQNEYLRLALVELKRLNNLSENVLQLSMYEHNKIIKNQSNINLHTIVEETINSLTPQLKKLDAAIHFNMHHKNIELFANEIQLKSVLNNVIDNAIKYNNNKPIVTIEAFEKNKKAIIEITDNGVGIEQKEFRKIFEKFYRITKNNVHNVKGYGLGLNYVAHIIKLHNGSIEIESKLNKGTKFIITIPKY